MCGLFQRLYNMLHRIKNAEVFAPESLGVCQLLIAAGSIVYIGREIPEISTSLLDSDADLNGARLIPGLIDGHAHVTGGGGEAGFKTRVPPVPLSAFTSAGVTTVIGLLGTDDTTRSTSSLVAQTMALREEGLSAWCYTGGYHLPPTTLTGSIKGDIVHVDCIIGAGEVAVSDHRSSQPTFDELAKCAGEAHVAGLMTGKAGIVHLHMGDGARGLELVRRILAETELPARVFNPTHCNRNKALFEEACELSRGGSWIDLTAFPESDSNDEWSAAEGLDLFLQSGCPADKITISSDGGGCLPVFNDAGEISELDYGRASLLADTLKAVLDQGMALETALPAFTSNAARLLRLKQKGELKMGADADLVVLDADHKIRDVMAGGVWHRQHGKQLLKGSFESQ
jgi:beta-aspartyl-dipeptidase (metallo-type)